ncbi:MAG: hypothetical protein ACOC2W_00810 [bacterium]
MIYLDEQIEEILDNITQKLKDAKNSGELKIKSVVRGDKANYTPSLPSLWIYTRTLTPSHSTSLKEHWEMPVVLEIVTENSKSVEEGYKESTKLAAKARSIILQDRGLGIKSVSDVTSGQFFPSGPGLSDGKLFSSMAILNVKFFTFE